VGQQGLVIRNVQKEIVVVWRHTASLSSVLKDIVMQRQVYYQPARSAEEADRRHAHVVTSGFIWAGADQIGWIENGCVFSVLTKQKFATLDENGNLYSLDGQSLNLHLETVNGGGRIGAESHSAAVAKFKRLARETES